MLTAAYRLSFYLTPLTAIVATLLGIWIILNKIRSVRILGGCYIISAVSTMVSFIYRYVIDNRLEKYYVLNRYIGMASGLCTIVSALCLCIFLHKNYGKKLIYIPLLGLPLLQRVLNAIASGIVYGAVPNGAGYVGWINLIYSIISLVTGSVTAIIVILVFYRNRKSEKVIPHMWIIRIVLYTYTVLYFLFTAASYLVMINGSDINVLTTFPVSYEVQDRVYVASLLIGPLVSLVEPIYVFVSALKAAPKDGDA
jgi:hypothetical protein